MPEPHRRGQYRLVYSVMQSRNGDCAEWVQSCCLPRGAGRDRVAVYNSCERPSWEIPRCITATSSRSRMNDGHCHGVQVKISMARLGALLARDGGRVRKARLVTVPCSGTRVNDMPSHVDVFSDATPRHAQAFPGVLGRDAGACLGVSRCSGKRPNDFNCHSVAFWNAEA